MSSDKYWASMWCVLFICIAATISIFTYLDYRFCSNAVEAGYHQEVITKDGYPPMKVWVK